MNTTRKMLAVMIGVALAVSSVGCSFIVDFDYENKSCGADFSCMPGFYCNSDNRCIRGNPPQDGGEEPVYEEPVDPGVEDAGTEDAN